MQLAKNEHLSHWKKELSDLVASATTAEDAIAMNAFEKALTPYLDNPGSLRTLLGKIQGTITMETIVTQREFQTLDEVKAILPNNIEMVAA